MNKKALILLSGGLDSFVSLDMTRNIYDIKLALTFDYGQKAFEEERQASSLISQYYNIENKVIELPFYKQILDNALTNDDNQKFNDFKEIYIPNRNGLFLNIASIYCEKYDIDNIIIGVNKKEAQMFSDNSVEFIELANKFFKYSTQKHPIIVAPCVEFDKNEIINYAIDNNLPLKFLKSCYDSQKNTGKRHCGICKSCVLLKEAILNSNKKELLKEIF